MSNSITFHSLPNSAECGICLDRAINPVGHFQGVKAIHTYCMDCFKKWMAIDTTCPECRAPIASLNNKSLPQKAQSNEETLRFFGAATRTHLCGYIFNAFSNISPSATCFFSFISTVGIVAGVAGEVSSFISSDPTTIEYLKWKGRAIHFITGTIHLSAGIHNFLNSRW